MGRPSSNALQVKRSGTAVILGRSNVGKSTLLNAALGQQLAIVTPMPQTTRDRILGVVRHGDAQIALLDTPGLHTPHSRLGTAMNRIAWEAVRGADVVVYVTALPSRVRLPLSPHRDDVDLLRAIDARLPVVLVINKIDLWKDKSPLLALVDQFRELLSLETCVPISALRTDGVDRVLDEIAQRLPECGPSYDDSFFTDHPLRFFASEYVREQVIRATSQEVPHGVAVTIERFDETPRLVHIDATIHCARSGHRAIIIGRRGERLKQIGTAARQRIEALLGCRICLKLWVRVTEGWMDRPNAMAELGYDPNVRGRRT